MSAVAWEKVQVYEGEGSANERPQAPTPSCPPSPCAQADKTVRLWDVEKGECVKTFIGHTSHVTAVSWLPGRVDRLVSGEGNVPGERIYIEHLDIHREYAGGEF